MVQEREILHLIGNILVAEVVSDDLNHFNLAFQNNGETLDNVLEYALLYDLSAIIVILGYASLKLADILNAA
jgi:hypothetical protein